ncbi:hypothetical protein D3C72_1504400 [compost metagenome]
MNLFLDYWTLAVIVFLATIIGFIPNLRDGINQILQWLKIKKDTEFTITEKGEIITFEIKTSSVLFDIVKINSFTHHIGVSAEYKWIQKYYPEYEIVLQGLQKISIENEQYHYDVVNIKSSNGKEKTIYFDITSFFNQHGSTSFQKENFIKSKIMELHKKRN